MARQMVRAITLAASDLASQWRGSAPVNHFVVDNLLPEDWAKCDPIRVPATGSNGCDGGNLELWPTGPKGQPITIVSKFNRLVVMITHKQSWHSVSRSMGKTGAASKRSRIERGQLVAGIGWQGISHGYQGQSSLLQKGNRLAPTD
jgi:hypothetical protein